VLALSLLCFALRRWLTLVSISDGIAGARGLEVIRARFVLLLIAFRPDRAGDGGNGTGCLRRASGAPHGRIGGRGQCADTLAAAPLIGLGLMALSDWLGRSLLYPMQLPAGTVASIVGGGYFIFLLVRRRAGFP
jgi:ABC-type Fe3+-siderophore transport system permease subunit